MPRPMHTHLLECRTIARPTALIQSSFSYSAAQCSAQVQGGEGPNPTTIAHYHTTEVIALPYLPAAPAPAAPQSPCIHTCTHLVRVCDEVHVLVGGADLKGVRLVDRVLRALNGQALVHLYDAARLCVLRARRGGRTSGGGRGGAQTHGCEGLVLRGRASCTAQRREAGR